MIRIKRPVAAVGSAVLLAFSLSACGGGASDAPTDASQEDFCESWNAAFEEIATAESDPSDDAVDEFKEKVEELVEVGTPESISDEEREGFEIFADAVADADTEDFGSEADDEIPGVSEEDADKAEAFVTYAVTECTEAPETE